MNKEQGSHPDEAHRGKENDPAGRFLADLALSVVTGGAYRDALMAKADAQAYSQEIKAEADHVGLLIMCPARAIAEKQPLEPNVTEGEFSPPAQK